MKKYIIAGAVFLTIFFLNVKMGTIPSDKKETVYENYSDLFHDDDKVKYFSRSFYTDGTLINDQQILQGLRIYDTASDNVLTVCNVPGCTHLDTDKECLANQMFCIPKSSAIYKKRIFFIERYSDDEESKSIYYRLWLIDRDGQNKKMLKEIKDKQVTTPFGPVLVNERLYVQLEISDVEIDEKGYVVSDDAKFYVYEINMETDDLKCIYESKKCKEVSATVNLSYQDSQLLISCVTKEKNFMDLGYTGEYYNKHLIDIIRDSLYEEKFGVEEHTVIYNLATGGIEDISEDMKAVKEQGGFLSWWNGSLIFEKDRRLYLYNLSSKKISEYDEIEYGDNITYIVSELDDCLVIYSANGAGHKCYLIPPKSFNAYELNMDLASEKSLYDIDDENDNYISVLMLSNDKFLEGVNVFDDITRSFIEKNEFYGLVKE